MVSDKTEFLRSCIDLTPLPGLGDILTQTLNLLEPGLAKWRLGREIRSALPIPYPVEPGFVRTQLASMLREGADGSIGLRGRTL